MHAPEHTGHSDRSQRDSGLATAIVRCSTQMHAYYGRVTSRRDGTGDGRRGHAIARYGDSAELASAAQTRPERESEQPGYNAARM